MSRRCSAAPTKPRSSLPSHAPITLEVTKEAVRRIRRTLSRDEGEDLILRAYMSEDFREGHGRVPQQAHAELEGQIAFAVA